MTIWQREGPVHVQDVVLCAQEALQVLRVRGHLLGHGVRAACADQSLGEEQRHAVLLSIHQHLGRPDACFRQSTATPSPPVGAQLSAFTRGSRGTTALHLM